MTGARFWLLLCLVCALLAGDVDLLNAQNRKRPGQRNAGAKKTPPKSRLPVVDSSEKIRVAPVDPDQKEAAKASAATIDRLIEKNLAKHNLSPNPDASDAQFIRRVYLDIVGTIPTAKQTQSFINSKSSTKRQRVVDQLLNRPGYASHLFNYMADLLRIVDRSDNNTYTRPFGEWLKQELRNNRPYDELVHEILAADGRIFDNPAVGYTLRDPNMPLGHLDNTVRIFLGTRIGCAQCHDHPFDRWTQREFYQLAAFVGGEMTRLPGRVPANMKGNPQVPETFDQRKFYDELSIGTQEGRQARRIVRLNRSAVWEHPFKRLKFPHDYAYDDASPGDVVKEQVIFGSMPQMTKGQTRREAFAQWVTSRDNPRFTMTIVNRMWKRAFGVGLIEPEDDLRDETEASNPELMAFLVKEMKRLNYDLKEFQRIIYNTQAYQREVTYDELPPTEAYHFPGPILRRMTAEQVWDSLLTLTLENPDQYQRPDDVEYLQAVAVNPQTITTETLIQKAKDEQDWRNEENKDRRKYLYKGQLLARASELPQPLPDGHFLRQFGQSDRQIISDGNTDGTVPQILTMFNGPVTHMMLEGGSVLYNEVTACKTADEVVEVIFLSILNRPPLQRDRAMATQEIAKNRAAGVGNVIWALLNTREFLFIQ